MSKSRKQPNDECSSHLHGLEDLDLEEWLKDEDEQWANIERYEAMLNNHSQHVPAPNGFLAPQDTAPNGFLAPEVTAPHVPAKSLLDMFVNDIETSEANELDNIKLSSDYHQSSVYSIGSRCVGSRTSTQVASHAEENLICKNAPKLKRKRESIHDTTLQDTNMMFLNHTDQQNCVPIPNFTRYDAVQPPKQ